MEMASSTLVRSQFSPPATKVAAPMSIRDFVFGQNVGPRALCFPPRGLASSSHAMSRVHDVFHHEHAGLLGHGFHRLTLLDQEPTGIVLAPKPQLTTSRKRLDTVKQFLGDLLQDETDSQPFILAIHGLIENGRRGAARQMLEAAPDYILRDHHVAGLRSVLAPPVLKRIDKRDVDRREEYHWLRQHANEYRGRWIALVGGTVVAHAPTLRELQAHLALLELPRTPLLQRIT